MIRVNQNEHHCICLSCVLPKVGSAGRDDLVRDHASSGSKPSTRTRKSTVLPLSFSLMSPLQHRVRTHHPSPVEQWPHKVWSDIVAYATATPYDLDGTCLGVFEEYDPRDIEEVAADDYGGPYLGFLNAQRRVFPTKCALLCTCKLLRSVAIPFMYECLIIDRNWWWNHLMRILRVYGWGNYTRRIEFVLGDREVSSDTFIVLAALLLCPMTSIVGGFNLGRLVTKMPQNFQYRITYLDTTIEQAMAIFITHPLTLQSIRTLELHSSTPGALPLTENTTRALHFPNLTWLRVEFRLKQNHNLFLFTTWSMPALQALLLTYDQLEQQDVYEPVFYGIFDFFGPTITLLSIQCKHPFLQLPNFMLNRILEACTNLAGLAIDTSIMPWTLMPNRIAHPNISMIMIARMTLQGAAASSYKPALVASYEVLLDMLTPTQFPQLRRVRILAPECVKEMRKWKQSEETKHGVQWFTKWRTHFAGLGIGLENCMGVDFFDAKGPPAMY